MLDHGIRRENGQFVLYLDEDRYSYEQLRWAVQYSIQSNAVGRQNPKSRVGWIQGRARRRGQRLYSFGGS